MNPFVNMFAFSCKNVYFRGLEIEQMYIRITVDERRKKADGTCPIYLVFANQGKTVYHGLGVYVDPVEFDKTTFLITPINKRKAMEVIVSKKIRTEDGLDKYINTQKD